MAVKGNNSTEKTVRAKSKYTGLAPVRVVSVNPTLAELKEMGVNTDNEPNYVVNKNDGKLSARLDFWLAVSPESEFGEIMTKKSFWVDNDIFVSKTGKTQFVNKYGKCQWLETLENNTSPYFLTDGARPAYKGEEKIHNFLSAYLNTVYDTSNKKYDECQLDNPEAFFKGDFSEIKNIVRQFKDNTVRVNWGVNEKGYQDIYDGYFERTCVAPNWTNWNKALNNPYSQFKADFQGDFNFKIYIDSAKPTAPTADAEKEEDVF